jgi:transposase
VRFTTSQPCLARSTYAISAPRRPRAATARCNRAVATRYDKLAVRYEATVHIAAINEWLRPGFLDTP